MPMARCGSNRIGNDDSNPIGVQGFMRTLIEDIVKHLFVNTIKGSAQFLVEGN